MAVLKDNSSDGDNPFLVRHCLLTASVCFFNDVLQVKHAIPRQMVPVILFLLVLRMGAWDLSYVGPSYLSFITLTIVCLVSDYAI